MIRRNAAAIGFAAGATLALLAGCAAREQDAPSFGWSSTPYYYARPSVPVDPWAAAAEREQYGLPDAEDAAKAAPATRRRAGRKPSADVPHVAVNPPQSSSRGPPPDPGNNCVGWWRICHFL